MTYKQVADMIKGLQIPYSYYQFLEDTAVPPPFICYYYENNADMLADSTNYQRIENLTIELYTDQKDFELEAAVENALNAAGLVYSREEAYINSERMYEVAFTSSVIITEE